MGEIVARAETDHPADAALTLRAKQRVIRRLVGGRIGQQGGTIVVEDKGAPLGRVDVAPCAGVTGAQITGRVVGRACLWRRAGDFAQPGAPGPVRRDQDPFVGQGVETSVWVFGGVEHGQSFACSNQCRLDLATVY